MPTLPQWRTAAVISRVTQRRETARMTAGRTPRLLASSSEKESALKEKRISRTGTPPAAMTRTRTSRLCAAPSMDTLEVKPRMVSSWKTSSCTSSIRKRK